MTLMLAYKANNQDNHKALGKFLKQQSLSKKAIIALKHRGGKICVNNAEETTRAILHSGDIVTVIFPHEPVSQSLLPVSMDINVIYEDEHLLVVDKKEGLPVIPTGHHCTSLANGILAYYASIGLRSTVHFVNRLDKGTSGLLLVAKYRHIHHLMTTNIKGVTRRYYARVAGVLKGEGVMDEPIFRPSSGDLKRIVHPSGQHAITHYEAVKIYNDTTLVRCTLKTGRTHQIRVHMAHMGHSILKDPLYGDGVAGDEQLLHSYFLAFVHPIKGERLCFKTGVPKDLKSNTLN